MSKHDTRHSRTHDGAAVIGDIPEFKAIKERFARKRGWIPLELEPLKEPPPHAERVRPRGPTRREGVLPSSFASADLRIDKDGDIWQVSVNRQLSANEYARMQMSGFEDVSENTDGSLWNASQRTLVKFGTDINHVAMALGKNPETPGRGR